MTDRSLSDQEAPRTTTSERGGGQLAPLEPAMFSPDQLSQLDPAARDEALAQLQQTHGNAFVNQLVGGDAEQKGGAGPAKASPLTAAQRASARSYHTLQPAKYTPEVVGAIRAKLGLGDGGIDDAFAQGIADFQAGINASRKPSPPLDVDGKCGPRTLPILIPVGLADDKQTAAFAADIHELAPALKKLTLKDRAALMMGAMNDRLKDVGVPPCPIERAADEVNRFAAEPWTIFLDTHSLEDPEYGARYLYHEARHAEQTYRVARMLAGRGHGAAQITAETGIGVAAIVERAIRQPLAPGTPEAVEAEGWFGREPGHHNEAEVTGEMHDASVAMVRVGKQFNDDPTPAREAAAREGYARYLRSIMAYRNLPTEYDSFFLGDKVGDALGRPRGAMPTFEEVLVSVKEVK
jgi:hypothetical protein